MLQRVLQDTASFDVVGSCGSGTEAWQVVSREKPQLVIMDVVLPGLSGFDLLSRFASMPGSPKTILVSALCQEQIVTQSIALGASFFIAKPCNVNLLLDQALYVARQAKAADVSSENRQKLEALVSETIHDIGIPASVKGYRYLREAILLSMKDKSLINTVTKGLYPKIAASYKTTPACVERSIRHAIEIAWDRCDNSEVLQRVFGCTVSSERGKPTNREFIALVAESLGFQSAANAAW